MKFLRILLLFITIVSASKAQIPNASFESWYTYALGEYPTGWMTSDSVAVALPGGTNNVYSGTDPYDGSLSMHLKSVTNVLNIKGPGMATNGKITFSTNFVFSGGSAIATRPLVLEGHYKYIPTSANDQGQISVLLTKDNAGVKDTIAYGISYFSGNVPTYTPFTASLVYQDLSQFPDTCLIIIQSSRGINDPDLGVGTELIIDSLGFAGTVGIEETNDLINSVNVFPTPAHNQLNVAVELKRNANLNCTIYDLNGKKVINQVFNSNKEAIDISSLAKGNYILKLSDEKNDLYSKNFNKE